MQANLPKLLASQTPPSGDWHEWGFIGKRGVGKTRAGAQWITKRLIQDTEVSARIAVAPNLQLLRNMFEEMLKVVPKELVKSYSHSNVCLKLVTECGKIGTIKGTVYNNFNSDNFRSMRFIDLWAENLDLWENGEEAWAAATAALYPGSKIMWSAAESLEPTTLVIRLSEPREGRVIYQGL